MVQRKIIWSERAKNKLFNILEFYIQRNQSKTYSARLYKLISDEVKLLSRHPQLGFKTTDDTIRGLIIQDYIIFYEVQDNIIIIHSIWDCRRDPARISLK